MSAEAQPADAQPADAQPLTVRRNDEVVAEMRGRSRVLRDGTTPR